MCLVFMQSEHMKKLLFPIYSLFFFLWTLDPGKRRLRSGRSPGRWPGCSSARSRPRSRCSGRRGVLTAGLMTLWPDHGWLGSATPSYCGRPGSVQGTARRDESRPRWLAAVLLWLAAADRAAGGMRRRGAG